jgi:hypothetical protein
MRDRASRFCARVWRSDSGSVAVMVALMLAMLIGFAALGTEVVYALFKQRQMQATASSAALAGATALMTGHPADLTVEARAVAATAGFTTGVAGATVTVNHPPLSGVNAGNTNAVEVVVGQPQTLPLSKLFYAGPWNISARAVATAGSGASDCVLALDTSNTTAVTITNGAQVTLNQCGLGVNANGSSALAVSGGAVLTAKSVSVSGAASVTNGATINATDGVKTAQPAMADPYSGLSVPSGSGCKYGSLPNKPLTLKHSNSGTQTLNPDGVYCGGLAMGNDAVVVMNPGVYIINGGSFNIGGAVRLTGAGVTIVLTGSGSNYATVTIGNGATVDLSAPSTGATAGLIFFQNPNAPKTGTNSFQGGAYETLTGALYFPSQTVVYSNGTNSTATCTQLVAWHIQFVGGSSFNSSCGGTGVNPIGGSVSELVE